MRTTGPAKTIRLLTKGGSLPTRSVPSRQMSAANSVGNVIGAGDRLAVNGTTHISAARQDSASYSPSNTNVSAFLRNAVVELISKSKTRRDEKQNPLLPAPGDIEPSTCAEDSSVNGNGEKRVCRENLDQELVSPQFPRWKRCLDIFCICLTLPLWLPLTMLAMLWIKIASPGPVFYRQERIGYRKNRFMMFKFRSMKVNAETRLHESHLDRLIQADNPMTKLDASGDPRLIPGGVIFRATGLDELPQIFNVLRGEMSLVGPRPCTRHEFARYQSWQQERVDAPPGLTGYWQVNGKNKTTFSEMVAMDIYYAKNMSFWLDLAILLRTVPAIVSQILETHSHRVCRTGKPAFDDSVPSTDNFATPVAKQ